MNKVETIINQKIGQELTPEYLELINESSQHNVPKNSETHFKIIVVSSAFQNLTLIKRHQLIYAILKDEMKKPHGIHALSIQSFTPLEWQARQQQVAATPKCRGGFGQ